MSPKMKTNKSMAKRFKVTGTGKLTLNKPGARHIMAAKSGNKKRHMRKKGLVDSSILNKIKKILNV